MGKDGDMGLLILIILIIAAVTGTLWSVLKIAAGVALGIFLGAVLLAVGLYYLIRSRLRRVRRELDARNRRPGGGPPSTT